MSDEVFNTTDYVMPVPVAVIERMRDRAEKIAGVDRKTLWPIYTALLVGTWIDGVLYGQIQTRTKGTVR